MRSMCSSSNSACGRPGRARTPFIAAKSSLPNEAPVMNVMHPGLRDPSVEEFDTRTLLVNAARQAEERRYREFMIVDVDSHHYETDSFAEIIEFIEDPVQRQLARYTGGRNLSGQQGPPGYQE